MSHSIKKKSLWKRIARIAAKTILFTILFILLLVLSLHLPFVQRFVRQKVVNYLEKKLDTKVTIGGIYIELPKNIRLEDVYVEDRNKDTLLSGGSIKTNINLWRLILHKELKIESIGLDNVTAILKRESPDSAFNYQFITDAFAPKDTSSSSPVDTASSAISLGNVTLNKINLRYNDVVTGTKFTALLDHLDTRVDVFDPVRLNFDMPNTYIKGLTARFDQVKPWTLPGPQTPVPMVSLHFKKAVMENVNIDYRDNVVGLYTNAAIGALNVEADNIDLLNQVITLSDIKLQNSVISVKLPKNQPARIITKQELQQAQTLLAVGWKVRVASMDLANNSIQFYDSSAALVRGSMDYAHLNATGFSLKAEDFVLNDDTISGKIASASFVEKSGFKLEKLTTAFSYTSTEASLNELYLKTPGSEIKRSAVIRYASPQALVNDIGNMQLDIDLQQSKLLVKDLLTLVPQLKTAPAFAYPNTTWFLDSRITGRVSNMRINKLKVQGLHDTRIDIAGTIIGLPDMNKLQTDLSIRNIASSKRDIQLFIPAGSLPTNITIPASFNTNGQLKSNKGEITADLKVNTDLGSASVKGSFQKIADATNAVYNVTVNTSNMNVGTIIQNKELSGPVSATFTIAGTGYDPKKARIKLDGTIHSTVIHQYTYRNMDVHAALAKQQATISATMKDPNIDFSLNGKMDLSAAYPSVQLTGMIDSIKFQQLHITDQNMIFRGKIDASVPVTDPDNLQGKMYITQALFVKDNQRLQLDTIALEAGNNEAGQFIRLNSDIMTASLQGHYQLSEIPAILQQAVQPYFALVPASNTIPVAPYNFELNAYIADNPALKTFVPGLERMDSVYFRSHFSDSAWTATLNAAAIDMNGNNMRNLQIQAGTGSNALAITASIGQLQSGSSIKLNNTSFTASVANNKIDFDLNSKDNNNKDKYHFKGSLLQSQLHNYELSLSPDNLLLNYQTWSVSANNKIIIAPGNIQATNFTLSKNGQQLTINSLSSGLNAPLQIDFNNFHLSTITGFIQADSSFANGVINGKLVLTDVTKPLFTSDLTINDLSLKGDTVGNVHAVVSNKKTGAYNTAIDLTGRGNDVKIYGNYFTGGNDNFDLTLAINTLPLATVQAFSDKKIRGASGSVNGNFAVTGNFKRPIIKGDLKFNKAGFNFSMLNSYFSADQQTVSVNEQGIRFSRFEIRDSANNPLIVDGLLATHNFVNYDFDLDVRANNFRALNSTKKDNRLFYGQLYFNTNLKIKGTESAPQVDGTLVINDKTKMTVVLPQAEPGIVEREGIIEFIDKDAPITDSLFLAAYDSLNNSGFSGLDIAVNITIVPQAEFNLIIDEGNGDFLSVKGDAALTAGIDPSGKITLTGTYELDQGSYELTFNLLRRKFNIEKGSRITWEGEPTDATLDVKAIYVANAAPLDLVKDQLGEASSFTRNTYLQKLPFDVHLNMQGKLMQPDITFDIVLPENKNYAVGGEIITNVRTRLEQLRQEAGEMNKQVFSLLLLNRFVTDNPFTSSGGGPSASMLARQSVSKLLTEQLNQLASDLIAGVDINFDVLSSEDYTTGERKDRTDLNVALSKRLLNDRLTVSVGSNFELEGPQNTGQQTSNIAGNLALDYRISKDNRYVLRAYRKNEYQGVIEGYIIETGVGFIISLDYNRFREIFISKKEREERRLRRQEQRKIDDANKSQTQPTDSLPAAK